MLAALAAALGRPAWWSMALAAFLIRGGIVIVLLPLVAVPSLAALTAALSPTVSALAFSGLTPAVLLTGTLILFAVVGLVVAAGLGGAWLDRAQLREAAADEDLELAWVPIGGSLRDAFALRIAAHLPTLAAALYVTFRLIAAGYDEVLAPGDAGVPLALRILGRAPETIVLLGAAWLLGEAVGGLAARGSAAGAPFRSALGTAVRQALRWRGIATLAVTSIAVAAALALLLFVAGNAWRQLSDELLGDANAVLVGAALLVLVSAWILGLAILGAALAWRTAAWTAEALPAPQAVPDAALIVAEA